MGFLKVLGAAVLTAAVTLSLASVMGAGQRDLAERVDNGTAATVCILSIDPTMRTDAAIEECLRINDYVEPVQLPEGSDK